MKRLLLITAALVALNAQASAQVLPQDINDDGVKALIRLSVYSKLCKSGAVKPEYLRAGEVVARHDSVRFNQLTIPVMEHLSKNGTETFCALMDAYFTTQIERVKP
jgi:hypothetical protein